MHTNTLNMLDAASRAGVAVRGVADQGLSFESTTDVVATRTNNTIRTKARELSALIEFAKTLPIGDRDLGSVIEEQRAAVDALIELREQLEELV